jgi:hypothetical protein
MQGKCRIEEARMAVAHFITHAGVINETNFAVFALSNVIGSSQAKYYWGYAIERKIKLMSLVIILIDGPGIPIIDHLTCRGS